MPVVQNRATCFLLELPRSKFFVLISLLSDPFCYHAHKGTVPVTVQIYLKRSQGIEISRFPLHALQFNYHDLSLEMHKII
jgi:hypothetical protein